MNDNTGLLTIDRVEAGDYGKYICSAVNQAGQNETEIEVEVLVPPKIFELYNTTAAEKSDGRLECKATGRPAPRITFRKLSSSEPFLNGPNGDGRYEKLTKSKFRNEYHDNVLLMILWKKTIYYRSLKHL